jgi:hypothetical protein
MTKKRQKDKLKENKVTGVGRRTGGEDEGQKRRN